MILQDKNGFVLPELQLSSLPTGAVKALVNKLGQRIANGQYAIGKNMPMEPELVAEHGVSRTVVREAIKVLSGKGLVRTARRYGTHVCDIDEWNLLDPDVIGWHAPESPMARRIFIDATQFRLVIEPQAAALAAVNSTKIQRELLRMSSEALEDENASEEYRLAADFAFHATVLDASGSLILKQFRGFLHAILKFSYSTGAITINDSRLEPRAHSKVAAAIVEGNADLAEQHMRRMAAGNVAIANTLGDADLVSR